VVDGRAEVRIGPVTRSFDARDLGPGPARIAVRPSRIKLTGPGTDGAIPGVLVKATYVGSRMEYLVATDLGELFVTSEDVGDIFTAGADVGLVLAESGPVLIPAEDTGSG
jgi:iron(III) transport system ATP-binding protein